MKRKTREYIKLALLNTYTRKTGTEVFTDKASGERIPADIAEELVRLGKLVMSLEGSLCVYRIKE